MCGQGCLMPNASGCQSFRPEQPKNGSSEFGGYQVSAASGAAAECACCGQCHCDGTARHNKTVGREKMPYSSNGNDLGPDYWVILAAVVALAAVVTLAGQVPQCKLSYYEYYDAKSKQYGGCLDGDGYKTVRGWDLDSTLATACDNCDSEPQCTGWRTLDNLTGQLE